MSDVMTIRVDTKTRARLKKLAKEADAGNFATEQEVQALLRKWRKRAR